MTFAWHIYFTTYGTWLHGNERGSRDRDGWIAPDPVLEAKRREQMSQAPFTLTPEMRKLVAATIREVCRFKKWRLLAVDVRSNHVHLVIEPDAEWWSMLKAVKARATRALREGGFVSSKRKVWTAKGGRKRLRTETAVTNAIAYVKGKQDWRFR